MPPPRYQDVARNGSSPRKKDSSLHGPSSARPQGLERSKHHHHKTIVSLPHDPRFVYPFAAATGRSVIVQVKSGVEFEGLLHGPVLGSKTIHITLKDARKILKKKQTVSNQEVYETLIIPSQEFVQMKAAGIPFHSKKEANGLQQAATQNDELRDGVSESSGSKVEIEETVIPLRDENDMAGFEGDLERVLKIEPSSNSVESRMKGFGRDLVPWDGGEPSVEMDLSTTKKGDWCQFEANEGIVESTFSMDQYTSKLDISKSKYTKEEAARIAREIEASSLELPSTVLDDSGIQEEEEMVEESKETFSPSPPPTAAPRSKPFSWADAVKGTAQSGKAMIPVNEKKMEMKIQQQSEESEILEPNRKAGGISAHQMDTPSVFEPKVETHSNSGFEMSTVYTLPTAESSSTEKEKSQQMISALDPVWNEERKEEILSQNFDPVGAPGGPISSSSQEERQTTMTSATQVVQKSEMKKANSTVVPGISFKDKLKVNLKTNPQPPPAAASSSAAQSSLILPATKPRPGYGQSVDKQGKMKGSTVDPTTDPVVQSPRGGGYSGKLITCPASSTLRATERNLPSEEHLMAPGGMPPPPHHPVHDPHRQGPHPVPLPGPPLGPPPPHPMFFSQKPQPGMMPMIPHNMQMNIPPPGYRDLSKEGGSNGNTPGGGGNLRSMPYPGGFGTTLEGPIPPHHAMPVMNPAMNPSIPETVDDPAMGNAAAGKRAFQLNPMAKSYKPSASMSPPTGSGSGNPSYYPPGERFISSPMDPGQKPPTPLESTGGGSVSPKVGRESMPPPSTEYNGNQTPGPQGHFIPPNVVTPWPSFPGTGVWHSGLGGPRPGAPGFMPTGMPSPYPMFMPGMPPFMGTMQDPMWRPPPHGHPPMPGMPDQQSLAMMWTNYYSHLVPPNKRMWNSAKVPPGNVPVSRQGRNRRPPPPSVSGQTNVGMP